MNRIDATLTNVRVHNSAIAALTVNGGAKAMVSNSVFSGSTFGLDIEQANTSATVDGSTISGNTTGIFTNNGAVLRLSNSTVSFNGTGVNGTVNSFSNNRFVENGAGGTITPIGAPRSDRPAVGDPGPPSPPACPQTGGRFFLVRRRLPPIVPANPKIVPWPCG